MPRSLTDALIYERIAARKKVRLLCRQIDVEEMQIDDGPEHLAECLKLEAQLELAARALTVTVNESSPATYPPGWKITPDVKP